MNARDVDVSVPKTILGKRILVVGGGMTAATLAISACRRGAKSVTLLSRRRLTVSEFECDVKYFGNKGLRDFQACGDMQRRAEMLETYAAHAENGGCDDAGMLTFDVRNAFGVEALYAECPRCRFLEAVM